MWKDSPESAAEKMEMHRAVLIRKHCYANSSEKWTQTQAIFMIIFRNLRIRGQNRVKVLGNARKSLVRSELLPH